MPPGFENITKCGSFGGFLSSIQIKYHQSVHFAIENTIIKNIVDMTDISYFLN